MTITSQASNFNEMRFSVNEPKQYFCDVCVKWSSKIAIKLTKIKGITKWKKTKKQAAHLKMLEAH